MVASVSVLLFFLLEAIALVFAYKAVRDARTPQGAVAWTVFLLAAPYFAVPAFLFLGHHRYKGYIIARRDSEGIVAELARFGDMYQPRGIPDDIKTQGFERLAELPVVCGNDAVLLIDGRQTFDAIFEALDAAESYALVQFYIINDDELGRALKDRLIALARRGVKVRLLYDPIGCIRLPNAFIAELAENGVEVRDSHARRGPRTRFHINFRNHRKTIVVDGHVGFLGGLNAGDEYMGKDPRFGPWRDTHLRLTGPMVTQLQLVFAEDWHWATGERLEDPANWDTGSDGGFDGLIMATGPGDDLETGSLYFCGCIDMARERIWIATPYFVPEIDILSSLKLAALKGVDVRILVPEVIDHYLPWLAAFAYFDEVLETGVQIWRYNEGFMHQKVLVVDDVLASIGTTNMDNRSCRLNFEATAMIFSPTLANATADMLEQDFARSTRLTKTLAEQPWKRRMGAIFARLLAPLL